MAFRCASEPVNVYVSKGGDAADTKGRVCICNALVSTAGFPQVRAGKYTEPGIVTMGDDAASVERFVEKGASDYSAADALETLTANVPITTSS